MDKLDQMEKEKLRLEIGILREKLRRAGREIDKLEGDLRTAKFNYRSLEIKCSEAEQNSQSWRLQYLDLNTSYVVMETGKAEAEKRAFSYLKLIPLEVLIPSETDRANFQMLCEANQHIQAIKALRARDIPGFGHMGLKEAKDLYELKYKAVPF